MLKQDHPYVDEKGVSHPDLVHIYSDANYEILQEDTGMIYEDVIFSLRVWAAHPTIILIPTVGYHYLLNPHSTTSKKHPLYRKKLYRTIYETPAPAWLKIYTCLRLFIHFLKS